VKRKFNQEVQIAEMDREISPADGLKSLVTFVIASSISVILFIGFLTAMFANWGIWVAASGSLIRFGAQLLIPAVVLAGIGAGVKYGLSTWTYYKTALVEISSKAAENAIKQAEAQRMLAEAKRLSDISHLDEQGNLVVRDGLTGRWQLIRGNMREHPALHSMHYSVKSESNSETMGLLPPGQTGKPKIEDLVKLVERNSFQLPFGNSLRQNGVPIVDIDSSHILIIGSSQKGKSCFAAALIDLVTKTHDPDTMVIALLDLENKTSKLFEDMEHLAVLNVGRKEVELHARNPRQVAEYLHYIRNEMDRRYSLPESEQAQQPHILVYIEEFLSLKKHRDLDGATRSTLLDDLNELAIRGLKVFIHLMACAQVDYADEDLKAFNNNFGINVSFAVKPTAARAAGFVCSELLNSNWESKQKGQCVVEATGCTDLVEAPDYDVKALLKAKNEPSKVTVKEVSPRGWNVDRTEMEEQPEEASQANLRVSQVLEAMASGINTKDGIIERVWRVKKGKGQGYQEAGFEYEQVMRSISNMARKGMELEEA
jgi:hypothetical protein